MFKKLIFPAIILFLASGFWSCQVQIDPEAEKGAIKLLVQTQLNAVIDASVEGEAAVWAQTPYIVRKDVVGWDSILVHYEKSFGDWLNDPENNQIDMFTASNFDIYINGNFASVFHDEHGEGIMNGEEFSIHHRVHKYVEKIEGEWKIITLF